MYLWRIITMTNKNIRKLIGWSFFLIYALLIFVFDLESSVTKFIAFAMLGILAALDVLVFKKS
jgi:hypothetical protein